MTSSHRVNIVQDSYRAFAAGDRRFFETHLSSDFTFSSPPDPHLDRTGWFDRCWPGAGQGQEFSFVRLVEAGDEVIVTYESRDAQGDCGRNTEVLTFNDDDEVTRTEVYFGWSIS